MLRWLLRGARPDGHAVWSDGRWHSYGELVTRSRAVAAAIRARTRSPRPIVALAGDSSFALVAAYLGVLEADAIPALLPGLSDDATAAALADCELAIDDPSRLDQIRALSNESPDKSDLAVVLYTSGSTAAPRGVMLSSDNLQSSAEAILDAAPIEPDDRALVTLPIHYCYGLSVLHTHLMRGAALIFPRAIADVLDLPATSLPAVPSLIQLLLRDAAGRAALARLRSIMISGDKLPDADLRRLIEAAPRTRIDIRYGITETTAAASFLPPDRLADKLGSIGRGLRDAPLVVVGDDGHPVAPGSDQLGEVVVRGPHVALGYRGGVRFDGTYRTGDRARVDADGFVYLTGRDGTFVKTGAHRISVEEIEDVLAGHPGVAAAAVCGVPHPTRGEALIALVVCRAPVAPAALRAHCAAALPPFKVPVELRIVDALPRTASGKLDRRAVAATARAAPP